jgi:DNA-binding FadR family transcriptional regulator
MKPSFSKIKNLSLKEQVIHQIETRILSGELKPGDRLPPERELAAAMGISRSLLNLCILELESKGFVRIVPRQGTFVSDYKKHGTPQILLSLMHFDSKKIDTSIFDNLMDTRRLLEHECTRLAIKNANDHDIAEIQEHFRAMEQAENAEEFIEGNFLFHRALTSASGNAVYAMIFNSFEHAVHFLLSVYFSDQKRMEESIKCHKILLEAMINKDEVLALETLMHTLDMGVEGLAGVFKASINKKV